MRHPNLEQKIRFSSLDFLRGISACGVMLFHYTISTSIDISDHNPLRVIGSYGHWGVTVFFIVSGFVIPYSMFANGYEIKSIGKFLLKRSLRIEIPFVSIIILELVLIYVSSLTPWKNGISERLDATNVLLHIGYLNGFLGRPWLIPIFWTLAIEFQFYLLMAFIYPLLIMSRTARLTVFLALMALSFVIRQDYIFFSFGLFFLSGVLTFQWKAEIINLLEFISSSIVVLISLYIQTDLFSVLLVISVLVIIIFFEWDWKWSSFLGAISFSVYLIHIPLGGRLLMLTRIYVGQEWAKSLLIILFLALTIFVAWIFYKLIERPSLMLSKKIQYSEKKI